MKIWTGEGSRSHPNEEGWWTLRRGKIEDEGRLLGDVCLYKGQKEWWNKNEKYCDEWVVTEKFC